LAHGVPIAGFHGTWVSEQQLQEQEQQAAAAS